MFVGYELWNGQKRIFSLEKADAEAPTVSRIFTAIAEKEQETAVELEERLQTAFACAARSRKLADTARKLRQQIEMASSSRDRRAHGGRAQQHFPSAWRQALAADYQRAHKFGGVPPGSIVRPRK